jgi:hypothetical protein
MAEPLTMARHPMRGEDAGEAGSTPPVEAQFVAWDRVGLVAEHDFIRRYSRTHVALIGADYALCGARIRWLYFSPGDGTRCGRCFDLALGRGYVTEHGYPLVLAPYALDRPRASDGK